MVHVRIVAIMTVAALTAAPQAFGARAPRDPAYGGGSPVAVPIGTRATLGALGPVPAGGVVGAGTAVVDGRTRTFVVRRGAGGEPDAAFGSGGVVLGSFGATADSGQRASAVATQPDGQLLTAGVAGGRLFVARYQPDGTLDPLFGAGGVAFVGPATFGPATGPAALLVRSDGRIVVAGSIPAQSGRAVLAIGLTAIGGIDPDFADGGVFTAQAGQRGATTPATSAARAGMVTGDGDLLLAGGASDTHGDSHGLLLRLGPDGSRDPTYRSARRSLPAAMRLDAITASGDGALVAGAATDAAGGQAGLVARLGPDGAPAWTRVVQLGRPTRRVAAASELTALGAPGLVAGRAGAQAVALRVNDNGAVGCSGRLVLSSTSASVLAAGEVIGTTAGAAPALVGLAGAPAGTATAPASAATGPVRRLRRRRDLLTGVADPGCKGGRAAFVSGRRRVPAGRLSAGGGPQAVTARVRHSGRRYRLVVRRGNAAR